MEHAVTLLVLSLILAGRCRSAEHPCQDELSIHPEVQLRPSMSSTNISQIMEKYHGWTNASFSVELINGTYNRAQFAAILNVNIEYMTVGGRKGDHVKIDCGDIGQILPFNVFCFVSLELVNCALDAKKAFPKVMGAFLHKLTLVNSAVHIGNQDYSQTARNITISQSSDLPPLEFRNFGLLGSIFVKEAKGFALDGVLIEQNSYAAFVYNNPAGQDQNFALDMRNIQIRNNKLDPALTESANTALVVVRVEAIGNGGVVDIHMSNVIVDGNSITEENPDLAMNASAILIRGSAATRVYIDNQCRFTNNHIISLHINETATAQIEGEFNSNTATPLVLRDSRETTVSVKMTNNVVTASSDDRLPISGGIHIVNSSAQINDSEFRSNIIAVPDEYSVGGGACINVGFLPENVSRHVIVSNSTFQACQVRLKHTTSAMRSFETYHGGGICVHFLPFVSRCKLSIIGCTFSECMAARGGALSVNFTEKASENEVTVTSSRTNRTVMKNNSATAMSWSPVRSDDDTLGAGGAIAVVFTEYNTNLNRFYMSDCNLIGNVAAEGGGVYALFSEEQPAGDRIQISDSSFVGNEALTGAAIYLGTAEIFARFLNESGIKLSNLEISDSKAYYCGALAATAIHYEVDGFMHYTSNHNSAVCLELSFCTVRAQSVYRENIGHTGGAIYSINSHIFVQPGATSMFIDNRAAAIGGAIFAFMEIRFSHNPRNPMNLNCFLIVNSASSTDPGPKYETTFTGNVAGVAGSAIYLNDITPCATVNGVVDVVNSPLWQHATFDNNTIQPDLYENYSSWTLYRATPGGSLGQLAKYQSERWAPGRIIVLPENTNKSLSDDTQKHYSGYRISTDIWKIYFLTKTEADTMNASVACSEEALDNYWNRTVTYHLSPGIEQILYGYACDRMNSSMSALLCFSVDSPQGAARSSHYYSDSQTVQTSNGTKRAGSGIALQEQSNTLRLTTPVDGIGQTDPITIYFLDDESDVLRDASVSVQVVGSSNTVRAKIHLEAQYCPPGFKIEKAVKDPGKYKCKCESKNSIIKYCDEDAGLLYITHGYWAAVTITPPDISQSLCPPGFCICSGTAQCPVDPKNMSAQCKDGRTGQLCGNCTGGKISVLDSIGGSCQSGCVYDDQWGWRLTVAILATLAAELLILGLNFPLSNDIKGLVFYHSVIFILPLQSDPFLDRLSAPESSWWQFVHKLWNLVSFNWPNHCFYPLPNDNTAVLNSIAYNYITPAMVVIILIPLHFLASWWMRRSQFRPIFDGTWLLLYFPFNHTLQTSMRLLAFTNIFGKSYFYYNAELEFFGRDHKIFGAVAIIFLIAIAGFLFAVFWLCADKWVPKCVRETAGGAKVALQVGLEPGLARQWWTWDLIRRVIILSFAMIGTGSEWAKHVCITLAIMAFLLFHVWAKPYSEIRDDETRRSTAFIGMIPLLRKRHLCNYLESAVLANMLLVCFLSAEEPPNVANSNARQNLLAAVMLWPTVLFVALLLIKLGLLVRHFLRFKHAKDHAPPQSSVDLQKLHNFEVSHHNSNLEQSAVHIIGQNYRSRTSSTSSGNSDVSRREVLNHPVVLEDKDDIRPSSRRRQDERAPLLL